jgi:hypothetical protein
MHRHGRRRCLSRHLDDGRAPPLLGCLSRARRRGRFRVLGAGSVRFHMLLLAMILSNVLSIYMEPGQLNIAGHPSDCHICGTV